MLLCANIKQLFIVLLSAVLFCGCIEKVEQPPKIKKHISYDFGFVKNKIQGWVDSGYYSGASIIVAKNDSLIYEDYFGDYTKNTQVFIASAGKWLAAATIASVVENTELSWDDRVNKWLPEFTDIKGEATLKQLFSHTSGYPDYQPKGNPKDHYQTLVESVKHIVDLPAKTKPGNEFYYGGLAMQVAGRMAELATNKDFETIFQENIAVPLGMKNTHFTPVDDGGGHAPMLGGGAKSTLRDYAHFLEMISNYGEYKGNIILDSLSVVEMQKNQVGEIQNGVLEPDYVNRVRAEQHKSVYGLGEWREELDANGNAVLISSPSWAGAYPWIDKTTNTYGFFLTHVNIEQANKAGFSSFYSSPVLPIMVRDVYKKAKLPASVTTGFIDVGNANLYYEELGKGEPLIFIHGHSFSHFEWEPQFFEFAKNFRTIRYDCRGYGYSSKPKEGNEFMHVKDLISLMDSLKIEKAHVVGLSMGGFIVTDMLALYQDRLLSATAASGDVFPVPGPSELWTEEVLKKRNQEIEELRQKGAITQKWNWLAGLMSHGGRDLEKIRRPVWDMIYKWDQWQPLHVEPRVVLGNDAISILKEKEIKVPVMILTGEIDKHHPNILMKLIPSAKQVIVPNAGHVSNLESPEDFNRLVKSFISEIKE